MPLSFKILHPLYRIKSVIMTFVEIPESKLACLLEQVMLLGVDSGRLLLRVGAPQQEHHARLAAVAHGLDGRVRHPLPAAVLVRVGPGLFHGEAGVEQEHALVGPAGEVPVVGRLEAGDVAQQLLE